MDMSTQDKDVTLKVTVSAATKRTLELWSRKQNRSINDIMEDAILGYLTDLARPKVIREKVNR